MSLTGIIKAYAEVNSLHLYPVKCAELLYQFFQQHIGTHFEHEKHGK